MHSQYKNAVNFNTDVIQTKVLKKGDILNLIILQHSTRIISFEKYQDSNLHFAQILLTSSWEKLLGFLFNGQVILPDIY